MGSSLVNPLADWRHSDRELLAYLAGLLDGEGYVGIKKSQSVRRWNPQYHERIQIRMVDEAAIALFAARFGGNYYREKPHAEGGRPLYCYQASDALAARVLWALIPYLRIKARVAAEVLALRTRKLEPRRWTSPDDRRMPPDELAARETLYLNCKQLNTGGGGALYGAVHQ